MGPLNGGYRWTYCCCTNQQMLHKANPVARVLPNTASGLAVSLTTGSIGNASMDKLVGGRRRRTRRNKKSKNRRKSRKSNKTRKSRKMKKSRKVEKDKTHPKKKNKKNTKKNY